MEMKYVSKTLGPVTFYASVNPNAFAIIPSLVVENDADRWENPWAIEFWFASFGLGIQW